MIAMNTNGLRFMIAALLATFATAFFAAGINASTGSARQEQGSATLFAHDPAQVAHNA